MQQTVCLYRFHLSYGQSGVSETKHCSMCGLCTRVKARQSCGGPEPKDCIFAEWEDNAVNIFLVKCHAKLFAVGNLRTLVEEWGACGKCSGQRKRPGSALQLIAWF